MSQDTSLKSDTKKKIKTKKPRMYKVVLHNDDYTTMDFVIEILVTVFQKTIADATKIMLDVHQKGRGIVGLYTYDIAVSKSKLVEQIARQRQFPLKTSVEEA